MGWGGSKTKTKKNTKSIDADADDSYDYGRRNTERISSNKKHEQRSFDEGYYRRYTEVDNSDPNEDKTK